MKKTKTKKDYQFFILLTLTAWLFLALILIFSSGAYRKLSLLTDNNMSHRFSLSNNYLEERFLYNLNDYQANTFRFSPNGQSFALIEKQANKDCLILNNQNLACYDKVEDLLFSPNSHSFAYIAKENNQVKVVVNGNCSDLYDWIFPPYFFSDEAEVFVFRARKGTNEMVVVNNIESQNYDRILNIFQLKNEKTLVYYALLNNSLWRGEINW
jgi:hypothetical protein